MNLDKLAGFERIDVTVPMGSSHFACTRFLNPAPPPSLPPPQPEPPAKGAPQGLPGA